MHDPKRESAPADEGRLEAPVRPAVAEGLRLAEKMMRDSWHTGLAGAWMPTREALARHLESAFDAAVAAERERCAAIARRWGETHADGVTVNARNAADKIARGIEGPNAELSGLGRTEER